MFLCGVAIWWHIQLWRQTMGMLLRQSRDVRVFLLLGSDFAGCAIVMLVLISGLQCVCLLGSCLHRSRQCSTHQLSWHCGPSNGLRFLTHSVLFQRFHRGAPHSGSQYMQIRVDDANGQCRQQIRHGLVVLRNNAQ